jgi:hypothetical protein
MVPHLQLILQFLEVHAHEALIAKDLLLAANAELLSCHQMDRGAVVFELASANDWPLQVNHHPHLHLSEFLGLLDHLNEHLVLLLLYSAHIDPEDVSTLLY